MKNKFPHLTGEMGQLICEKDWSATLLGPIDEWPDSLHFGLQMCLSNRSPSSICWGDCQIFLYNEEWGRLLGDKQYSLLGKPGSKIFGSSWDSVKAGFEQVLSKGSAVELTEYIAPGPGGDNKNQLFNLFLNPIPNKDGSVAGVFCTALEMKRQAETEKKQRNTGWSNDSITQQQQDELTSPLLSAIVKGSEDAIISKDLNSIITSWNDSAERMFGYTAEEALGQPVTILFPEDRIDNEKDIIKKIKKGQRIENFETKRKRKDGSLLDVSLTTSPIKDSEGNIVGASKIVRDISGKKQAEEKLRKSRNRLRTTLEVETVGIVSWGGDNFTIQDVNNAFLEMSGYDRDEVLGKSWRELTPKEFYGVSKKGVAYLKKRKDPKPYEKQYIRKDGTRWWGLSAPRRIDENEVVEFILDITERKEANEKLEALNATLEEQVQKRTKKLKAYQKQLRSLASQLNKAEERERQRLASELHDNLGQMLTVAKMKVDSLHYDQALTEIQELKQVIDDALKYSQNLMIELKPPPVLDKEDITEVMHWNVKKMEKKGLDITIEDDGEPKPVDAEIQQVLHQSVRELLLNIKKHADTAKARMTLARENGNVKITIEDNGRGFDVNKNNMSTAEDGKFGLFNIRERLDWHGGKFEIESKPGKGTKAVLHAPLKKTKASKTPVHDDFPLPPRQKMNHGKAQDIEILLVDDHEMVRKGLRQMIEKQDDLRIVAEAADGKEALKMAREISPHIIIMDVNMPVMNGIEATKIIKAEMPDIRIIGLSLHDSPEVIKDMKNAGASDYLTKSEAFESLIATIRAENAISDKKTKERT